MNDFEQWQENECRLLGITVEEHNRILEVSKNIDATLGIPGSYDYITGRTGRARKLTELVARATLR